MVKNVTLAGFKGYDYWDGFLLRVSGAAENNDYALMKSLVITEAGTLLNLDLTGSGYDELLDKDAVFKAMIKNGTEYASQEKLIKEFYGATTVCKYNLNKSPDALKHIYQNEATNPLFDLCTSIPQGTEPSKTVLDTLPSVVSDKVYEEIFATSVVEKASDITSAFVLHTLTGTIKNADHYGTVKTALNAYNKAGLINLNIKDQHLDAVCKQLMTKSFQSLKAVEDSANAAAKSLENSNTSGGGGSSGGGGGGGGGSASPIIVPTKNPEPLDTEKPQEIYQSGEMIFTDMEDSKWALEAVNLLYQKGIVSGSGDNKFEPGRAVTRAEMAKMAVDTAGMTKVTQGASFADVSKNDWFHDYVMTACKEGIFVGREENMFASKATITRQEAAVVIYRMIKDKLPDSQSSEEAFSDDWAISDWAREAVYALRSNGIMRGRSNTDFCPGEILTRAEAAILFSNIIKYYI